jgi:hexosaminidase
MKKRILVSIFSLLVFMMSAQKYSVIPRQYYSKVYGESFSIKNTQVTGVCEDSVVNLDFVKKWIPSNDSIKNYSRFDILIDTNPLAHESYRLKIFKNDFVIHAGRAGAFYALQTIKQLDENGSLFPGEIIDYPTYKYRGMHLDVCRHFFTVTEVKKYIDMLARYKFNTFHWHLTEDQGWRIEIKKYPKLTEIGSKRKETLIGKQKDEKGTGDYDKMPVEGFYTQEQIKEVVKYAQERFITIIPEIELPGHSLAAVASYPHLGCTGKSAEVGTRWGVYDDVYCAGKESTFKFLQDVMDEVLTLFPSKYIHIGGDEVVKSNWKKCILCQNRIKEEKLKDEHELQSYFIQRMEKYLNSKGRQIIGWDEILEGGLAPNATVMSWRGEKGGIEAAKAKHDVIMTPGKPCYFDHGYTKSKEEPINIGGKNSLNNVYNYNPNPFELGDATSKYILGSQGNVWTEYIADWSKVEYMVYPRMQALSEVLWLADNMKNIDDFKLRLGDDLESMDKKNMNYRIPEPIGYKDTLIVNESMAIDFKPMAKSHTLKLSIDDQPLACNNDKLSLEPSNKERKIKVVVSNGYRNSVPYYMIVPRKK